MKPDRSNFKNAHILIKFGVYLFHLDFALSLSVKVLQIHFSKHLTFIQLHFFFETINSRLKIISLCNLISWIYMQPENYSSNLYKGK